MVAIILAVSLLLFLCIYTWYKVRGKCKLIPKGSKELPAEKGFPIFGISFQIKDSMHFYFQQLSRKHGSIFVIKLGMRDVVVLNNFDVISKALKQNAEIFSGRFETEYKKQITHDSGFLFHDGEIWSKQKVFIMNVLRDLGFGKSRSTEIVDDELNYLLSDLAAMEGKKVNFYSFITLYVANVISKFFLNKRFNRGNEELSLLCKLIQETVESRDSVELLSFMFPFLNNSPLFVKVALLFSSKPQLYTKIFHYYQHVIREHLKRLDQSAGGEDFIERFLIEQHKIKEKLDPETIFTDWQLIMTVHELIVGGLETTSTMLHWSCMFLSKFPDIQNKVYLEIVDKVGTGRRVTINDKVSLNYTLAVMDEIMRMSSILPLNVPHRSLQDSHVNGFFIPKNSIVFTNIFGCHYDPEVWEDPIQFRPERFLMMDSNGEWKFSPRKELIPFGIGKRQCIGESLARMKYFIILTNIVQNFIITSAEEITDHKYERAIHSEGFLIRSCLVKEFIFQSRIHERI